MIDVNAAEGRVAPREFRSGSNRLFLRGFLRDPRGVASVLPSTRSTVRRMLGPLDWSRIRTFVEYGPGVGTFTNSVLERLAPDARLIAIDTNAVFVDHLRRAIPDQRFFPVLGSAEEVGRILGGLGEGGADAVLSGLPFSRLPVRTGRAIMTATAELLRPGGCFMAYQVRADVERLLSEQFALVERQIQWWNVPPLRLWWASHAQDRA